MPARALQPFAFPKEVRLRRRAEFLRVQEAGRKVAADCLLALVLPNGREVTRLGLTVSTKVGNAVVRNRIRRVLRELFRTQRDALPKGLDMVLIARQSAADADSVRLGRAFERVTLGLGELSSRASAQPRPPPRHARRSSP
jgi:ribonuclease P protein component